MAAAGVEVGEADLVDLAQVGLRPGSPRGHHVRNVERQQRTEVRASSDRGTTASSTRAAVGEIADEPAVSELHHRAHDVEARRARNPADVRDPVRSTKRA